MAPHPLIALAVDKETKQSKGFREVAARLNGEGLREAFDQERESAPRRADAGKRFFGVHPKKPPEALRNGREEEHLGLALVRAAQSGGGLELPEGGEFFPLDYQVPLAIVRADKALGEADPNWGVGKVGLLGIGPDERLALMALKYVAPDATRAGTGETPLRFLLQALAHVAIVEANRDAIVKEMSERFDRSVSSEPPVLYCVASPRYWQLCRKREAQKGAAWIKELERLAGEIEESIGVAVRFLRIELPGETAWSYDEGGPVLSGEADLGPAWERTAGRVRPRARPRARKPAAPEEVIVEADLSRPVRPYATVESFAPGDRIQHPTLGMGVVQGEAGPGKIHVLFGEKKSLLVHERQPVAR